MQDAMAAAEWLVYGFLVALACVVGVQLFTGRINTHGLLEGRMPDGRLYTSPERIQLLAFTFWVAGSYLRQAIDMAPTGKLPDVEQQTLVLLGGSHTLYLGGKAFATFWSKAGRIAEKERDRNAS